MGQVMGIAAVVIFIGIIIFIIRQEINKEYGSIKKMPKEYRSVMVIGGAIFLVILLLLIYTNFFMNPHYSY